MFEPTWISDCGMVKLWHCDSLQIIQAWCGIVDAIITDPPYGCRATTGWGGAYHGFELENDKDTTVRDAVVTTIGNMPFAMFGSPRIPRVKCKAVLIWAKGEHTGMGDLQFPWKPDYEEIYVSGDGWNGARTTSVIRVNARTDSKRHHATEKPVELMCELCRKAPGDIIADPFMGSGSTGVAAVRLGRTFYGCEIDERYFARARKRIQAELTRFPLFTEKEQIQCKLFDNG